MIAADRVRPFVALLLLSAHLWLAPFAYADPPDPTWLGGVFDEGDHDDVVLLVMAMTGMVETGPTLESAAPPAVSIQPDPACPCPLVAPLRARPIRAPPPA